VIQFRDGSSVSIEAAVALWSPPDEGLVEKLEAAEHPMMLIGPHVVRSRAVPGLHALATGANLGVLNTWGAKGVFDWRSPHHLATAGLQSDDFELAGLPEADLIITCGVDPCETVPGWHRPELAVVDVGPGTLSPLASRWRRPAGEIAFPRLRTDLAGATQRAWEKISAPISPAVATRLLGERIGHDGLITSSPGICGYWIARTLPTQSLGTVFVPGVEDRASGLIAAIIAVFSDPDRKVISVWEGHPGDEELCELVDIARSLGVRFSIECWHREGPHLTAEQYRSRLDTLVNVSTIRIVEFKVMDGALDQFVEVAGPISAWPGLSFERS
jgi:hypothetical protein